MSTPTPRNRVPGDDEAPDQYHPPYHCAVFIGRGKMHCADMGLRQCRECEEEEKRS